MDEEAPGRAFAGGAVDGPEGAAERTWRVHLDPVAVAHPLEDRSSHQDRFERPPVPEPAVQEVDGAQLGDRVVRVADVDPAREALGEIAEYKDERERIGLVAGNANESGGGEIGSLPVIAAIGGHGLVGEELGEKSRGR